MAKKLIDTDKLTAIANAIRGKTNSTDTYSVDGMVDAISNISTGGGDTSIEDGLIDGTLSGAYSNDRVTKIKDYTFYNCSSLTTVDLPVATSVGGSAFRECSSLTTADFPVAKSVGTYAFYNCSSLTTVDLPVATSVGTYAFYACRSLTTFILRNTTKVCALSNTNAFNFCYHYHGTVNSTYNPDGLKDGYIYVPASLIDDYKVATNWSTLATQFRALEDYTVDGTTTGELDESKI